jgi:hypothetical protein
MNDTTNWESEARREGHVRAYWRSMAERAGADLDAQARAAQGLLDALEAHPFVDLSAPSPVARAAAALRETLEH